MHIQLTKVSDGVYQYDGYTAIRRKWCAPSVCTSWDVVTPSGDKIECDTLREAREFIAEDVTE